MIKDRIAFDLPAYDGLLAGHYVREQGYGRRRPGGTDDWLLVMTLRGRGRFTAESGQELFAEPDSLVLVAPGTTHDYGIARQADTWEILWVHFQPPVDWLDLLEWPRLANGIFSLNPEQTADIESSFWEVLRAGSSDRHRKRQFSMNALEKLLLLCAEQVSLAQPRVDPRIRSVLDHMHRRLADEHSLEDLSGLALLSSSRFSHLFREQVGVSPRQYLLQQRLGRGRALLERTSLGVAEIAREVGMDPFQFSLRFRKEVGKSPRDYRNELQSTAGIETTNSVPRPSSL